MIISNKIKCWISSENGSVQEDSGEEWLKSSNHKVIPLMGFSYIRCS